MKLYNTASRKTEELVPIHNKKVTLYTCGPTVYDETHIGHMRKYTMDDILKRTLKYLGYDVNHVMNITDVGHLSGDDDSGEDKLEKGAKKHGKTVWDVAKYYTDKFFETMDALNLIRPNKVVKATEHIKQMVDLVKRLEEKGFTYQTPEAVYFDVTKFRAYGRLSGQRLEEKKQAARGEVYVDPGKKHPADFALWFKRIGRFKDHTMHWESPWGDGFPGWHIECSAMSMAYLGETIDIHTGGIDHIPVHHENEIAQSEAATGKKFVNFWVHHAFLQVQNEKMSKSKGNYFTLEDLKKHNIDPIAMRYLFLQTHYRQEMNFTWKSVEAAQESYLKLIRFIAMFAQLYPYAHKSKIMNTHRVEELNNEFINYISNDLDYPKALSYIEIHMKNLDNKINPRDRIHLLLKWDLTLGIGINETYFRWRTLKIPYDKLSEKEKNIRNLLVHGNSIKEKNDVIIKINQLAAEIDNARKEKDFNKSDNYRKELEGLGYSVQTTAMGTAVVPKNEIK